MAGEDEAKGKGPASARPTRVGPGSEWHTTRERSKRFRRSKSMSATKAVVSDLAPSFDQAIRQGFLPGLHRLEILLLAMGGLGLGDDFGVAE